MNLMGPDFHDEMGDSISNNSTNDPDEDIKGILETTNPSSPAAQVVNYQRRLRRAKEIIRNFLEMHGKVMGDLQPGANFLSGDTIRAMNEVPAEAKEFLDKIEVDLYGSD